MHAYLHMHSHALAHACTHAHTYSFMCSRFPVYLVKEMDPRESGQLNPAGLDTPSWWPFPGPLLLCAGVLMTLEAGEVLLGLKRRHLLLFLSSYNLASIVV